MLLIHAFVRGMVVMAVVGLVVTAIAVPVVFGVSLMVAAVRLAWAIVRFEFGALFLPFSIRREASRRAAARTRHRRRHRLGVEININVLPTPAAAGNHNRSLPSGTFATARVGSLRHI